MVKVAGLTGQTDGMQRMRMNEVERMAEVELWIEMAVAVCLTVW